MRIRRKGHPREGSSRSASTMVVDGRGELPKWPVLRLDPKDDANKALCSASPSYELITQSPPLRHSLRNLWVRPSSNEGPLC